MRDIKHPHTHTFPTRRSSDLVHAEVLAVLADASDGVGQGGEPHRLDSLADAYRRRLEEHTSELQSPCNLVYRLLLEKKNNKMEQIVAGTGESEVMIEQEIDA